MRLFVALPLPPEVQTHLELAVDAVRDGGGPPRGGPGPLRWVPPELRHITLAFYGEVPAGAVPALTADLAAAAASAAPMTLQLRGAGVFAGRTLWVGAREVPGAGREEAGGPGRDLERLMGACEEVGERHAHVERRGRRRAHVTVARARSRRAEEGAIDRRSHALAVYAGPPWQADHLRLVASELGAGRSGGPLHEVLEALPLGGA
jgi:2'-5' RNA ligase